MSGKFYLIFLEGRESLRRPVIRAAAEFEAVPLSNDRKIYVKLLEFNTFSPGSSILCLSNQKAAAPRNDNLVRQPLFPIPIFYFSYPTRNALVLISMVLGGTFSSMTFSHSSRLKSICLAAMPRTTLLKTLELPRRSASSMALIL